MESSLQTDLALPAHKAIKVGRIIATRMKAGRTPRAVKWQMKKNEAARQARLKSSLSTYLAERLTSLAETSPSKKKRSWKKHALIGGGIGAGGAAASAIHTVRNIGKAAKIARRLKR